MDRLRLYTALRSAWDAALSDGDFKVVAVRGPGGSGRTAMLQAFYRHCAMDQPLPRYWPFDLVAEEPFDPVSRHVAAEVLFPSEFVVPENARLPFLWWGLRGAPDRFAA